MGKTKKDLVRELNKLNTLLESLETEEVEFDPEDTNVSLEAFLEEGHERVADIKTEAKEKQEAEEKEAAEKKVAIEKEDAEVRAKAEAENKAKAKASKKGKYTLTDSNGDPYPTVFENLEEAERVAEFIHGTIDE